MKKALWICSVVALLVGVIAYANADDPAQQVRERGRVIAPLPPPEKKHAPLDTSCGSKVRPFVVAVWPTVPPFGWIEVVKRSLEIDVYEPYGLFYDLLKTVAEHNNKSIELYKTLYFNQAVKAVERGKADIILGYYYNDNPYVNFQPLYPAIMQNPIVIITLKDAMPEEKALDVLTDKLGVMRSDEQLYGVLHSMLPHNMQIKQVPSAKEAFQLLLARKVDFMITSRYAAEAEIRRFKLLGLLDISPAIKYPAVFFAVAKNGRCKKEIEEFFQEHMAPILNNHEEMGNMLRAQLDSWEDRFLYDTQLQPLADTKEDDDEPAQVEQQPENTPAVAQ
ncbi:MAG: transporter substrate-binding domain-containing protein [Alphaproteobacteria bacterium]|nr:transporter substrate-binding domain-containing protein [Alphaproteobacteria bacterium]